MSNGYTLTKLDPASFEHLVNMLALRVLGAGHATFGPGADGGRDGYFEGEAPYPSLTDRWKGKWYIQSKFHPPHLSKDPQKWLLQQIKDEIQAFNQPETQRRWPDIWIVATNIDPSGAPMTGVFDAARTLVEKAHKALGGRFHIWGGKKIIALLGQHPEIGEFYSHFLTPGHIFTALYHSLKDARAEVEIALRFLVVRQFTEQQYTKLEQAGSDADTRPGIHKLYIDIPFRSNQYDITDMVTSYLVRSSGKCHRLEPKQSAGKE